jgi:hypothetical protein
LYKWGLNNIEDHRNSICEVLKYFQSRTRWSTFQNNIIWNEVLIISSFCISIFSKSHKSEWCLLWVCDSRCEDGMVWNKLSEFIDYCSVLFWVLTFFHELVFDCYPEISINENGIIGRSCEIFSIISQVSIESGWFGSELIAKSHSHSTVMDAHIQNIIFHLWNEWVLDWIWEFMTESLLEGSGNFMNFIWMIGLILCFEPWMNWNSSHCRCFWFFMFFSLWITFTNFISFRFIWFDLIWFDYPSHLIRIKSSAVSSSALQTILILRISGMDWFYLDHVDLSRLEYLYRSRNFLTI